MNGKRLFNDLPRPQSTTPLGSPPIHSQGLPSLPAIPQTQPVQVNRLPRPRKPDPFGRNPLARAINIYFSKSEYSSLYKNSNFKVPSRYTIYPPLLLLPEGTFTIAPFSPDQMPEPEKLKILSHIQTFFATLEPPQREELLESIIYTFKTRGTPVTHIAINAPIALTTPTGYDNVTRTPTGLVPLYGDFGPIPSSITSSNRISSTIPGPSEFDKALWVSDKFTVPASQSPSHKTISITYTWAPTHTMYSHGNLSEKRRILTGTTLVSPPSPALSKSTTEQPLPIFPGLEQPTSPFGVDSADTACVDFYVGIGYFALPYLTRGIGRVYGFDLSPWAIEGCRRGAALNDISCCVTDLSRSPILSSIALSSDRLILFRGDNSVAASLLRDLKDTARKKKVPWKRIEHVNLGLLPSSRGAWEGAVSVLDWEMGGWLHVHENVALKDIETMERDVVATIGSMVKKRDDTEGIGQGGWKGVGEVQRRSGGVRCVHVERVKSYAPGVWHVVYDVFVPPWEGEGDGMRLG